jgi:hypothetical protein
MGGVAALWAGAAAAQRGDGLLRLVDPEPVGSLVLLLLMLGVARFILNQIFD